MQKHLRNRMVEGKHKRLGMMVLQYKPGFRQENAGHIVPEQEARPKMKTVHGNQTNT